MKNRLVSLTMTLQWQDACTKHRSTQYFAKANLWRDILPTAMMDAFTEPLEGMQVQCQMSAGEAFEPFDQHQVKTIKTSQFNTAPHPGLVITPRIGRFYPRNFVRNEMAITGEDRRPMRVLAVNDETMDIDLNSPMAPYTLSVSVTIDTLLPPAAEHGGRCNDFVYDMLHSGVGLQSCFSSGRATGTNFFSGEPFARQDEREDRLFYSTPRLVQHLDAVARAHIEQLYAAHLQSGMQVLDLMSSWVSHLPATGDIEIAGLGMNSDELEENVALRQRVVHDLNGSPNLPFDDNIFDLVVCTASVEYLVHPFEVFAEVVRCLKPGGKFVVTFSDRWFPTKAIKLWSELHHLSALPW